MAARPSSVMQLSHVVVLRSVGERVNGLAHLSERHGRVVSDRDRGCVAEQDPDHISAYVASKQGARRGGSGGLPTAAFHKQSRRKGGRIADEFRTRASGDEIVGTLIRLRPASFVVGKAGFELSSAARPAETSSADRARTARCRAECAAQRVERESTRNRHAHGVHTEASRGLDAFQEKRSAFSAGTKG
jgi:hypothetical protein